MAGFGHFVASLHPFWLFLPQNKLLHLRSETIANHRPSNRRPALYRLKIIGIISSSVVMPCGSIGLAGVEQAPMVKPKRRSLANNRRS